MGQDYNYKGWVTYYSRLVFSLNVGIQITVILG